MASQNSGVIQIASLVALAVLFGGGGVSAAMMNLVVQFAALLVLALNFPAVREFFAKGPRPLVWLVVATLALPCLQIIPLPPAVWQSLPGRELIVDSLNVLGVHSGWRTLSVSPLRTALALAGLVAPFVVLVLALGLRRDEANRMLQLVGGLGLINVLLGAIYLGSGGRVGYLFSEKAWSGQLYGTFASHNAAGLFLVLSLIATKAYCDGIKNRRARGAGRAAPVFSPQMTKVLLYSGMAVLILGILLTQSRSAQLIGLFSILCMAAIEFAKRRTMHRIFARGVRWVLIAVACITLLVAGAALHFADNQRLAASVSRFEGIKNDVRPRVWSDALVSVRRFMPVGAGMGTFDEVFQLDESLEYLAPGYAVRAHNEYIEVAVEAGGIGIALVLAWLVYFGISAWLCWRQDRDRIRVGAALALLAIALQSMVDFTLRNQATLCVAALMIGLLLRPLEKQAMQKPEIRPGRGPRGSADDRFSSGGQS